ncbi:LOW QUALITY PROTEIN: uncharacterized protein [Amphiura filiformis]|uniref:LOW QUALITY PROTEIN: uncharacterized protein n=1 Tax=Amphiura filiformis TaxID=82378 RepID=UPI003B21E93A
MAEDATTGASRQSSGSHIFAEFESLEGLNAPIRASARIKYTSIGVSRRYIALGASTGGLYIFHRESLKYLQVLTNKEGAVTKVAFAPDDNIVGFATSFGFVIAWELNLDTRDQPERLAISTAHRNVQVTSLQWDAASLRLFSGDNKGRVTQTNADCRKVSGFFKMPTELLLTAESPIVQLDYADEKVLVSAQTKCVICDTAKKQSYTVGKKPRDGQFGGCFLQRIGSDFPAIYTGRPGSRVWEANVVGQVQATHQFKHLLAIPPLPVVGPSKQPDFVNEQKPQSFNFPVLLPMGAWLCLFFAGVAFLLTWTDKGVFIFDPFAVDVVVWTSDIKGIVDAGCHKGQLYCLQENGRLHRYFLLSIERCIAKLFGQSLWHQCAKMCIVFAPRVTHLRARRHIPLSLIRELNYQLMDNTTDLDLVEQLEDLVDHIKSASPGSCSSASSRRSSLESCDSVRLESGIYLIRNRHDSEDSFDDTPLQAGDDPVTAVTLKVPEGPYPAGDVTRAEEGAYSGDVFTSAQQGVTSGFTEVTPEPDCRIPVATDHEGTSRQSDTDLSHQVGETESDCSSKDRADSRISLESSSEINANTMQFMDEASTNNHAAQQLSNTMTVSHSSSVNSTNSEHQWEDVQLNEQISTTLDSKLNQSLATQDAEHSSHVVKSLKSKDHALQPDLTEDQLEENDIASCTGPRTTPSPEVSISQKMPKWEESLEETSLEHLGQRNQAESCIDSDVMSQESTSNILSQKPVPSTKSISVPIASNTSSSSLSHFEDFPDEDAPPTLPPVPHSLRRTMSLPMTAAEAEMNPVAEADMNPVVVRRRASEMGDTTKDKRKKKKKRKSRIAEIGETSNRPVQSKLDSKEMQEEMAIATSELSESLDPPSQVNPSPKRSMSTPSIHEASSLSSASSLPIKMHVPASSPITPSSSPHIAPRPAPNSVPRSQSRSNSWDNSNNMWHTSGTMPTPPMMFVDLTAGQKLNLPSVSESISAMKESLSSTLTNAKSFLLNKMDSKEELHHSVSSPTFNLYFPEDDRKRSRLEDPAVLYSPNASRKILKEWVQYLHAAVHQIYTEQHQLPPSEDTSPSDDKMPNVPDSSSQLPASSSELPASSSEQSDIVDQAQNDTESTQEQSSKAESVGSEEPSATESVMSETRKDIDEKAGSVETAAVTTTTSVNTTVRMSATVVDASKEQVAQTSSSSNQSFLGFLEKLGTGAHSMEIFDERRRDVKEQVTSKEETEDICDDEEDDLKMESVPDLIPERDNISIASDCDVTKSDADAPVQDSRHSIQSEPARSHSDAELASLCFPSHQNEVHERQIYCIEDPFSLPSEIHQEIGELVVMCFEMGVYGDLKQDVGQRDLLKDDESSRLQTKPIFEVGQSESEVEGQCDVRNSEIQLGSPFYVPKHLQQSNQSEQPESDIQEEEPSSVAMETDQDIVAAEFIKEYFHFFDVMKLRNVLGVREGQRKCSFEALISCLIEKYKGHAQLRKIEEAAADVGIDHLKTVAQKCPGLELCFATRIYEKSCEGGVKYMIMTHSKLKPWEVLDIITARNDNPAADFLTYVSGILDITPASKRDALFQSICKEEKMRLQLFQFALSHKVPPKGDLFCTCTEMPRPGSHDKDWHSEDLIHRMLRLNSSLEVKQQMLQYSQKYGHWHAVLMLLQELNERPKALKLAVQLADISVLSTSENQNCVIKVKNLEEWKIVLANTSRLIPCPSVKKNIEQLHCVDCNCIIWPKLNSQSSKSKSNKSSDWPGGVCLTPEEPECDWSESAHNPDWLTSAMTASEEVSDWLPTITWESIAVLLVRNVGAQVGVELLREAKVPEGALSKQFHQACIASALLEKGQSNLSHAMLERVDTYLWSKRPITMAPSLYQLVKNETKQTVVRKSQEPATIEEQMELLGLFSLPEGESHFLEEPDCHWGMHLDVNSNCCVCGAAFYNSLPMAMQGIAAFTCGHAFHKLCIPEKACVVCLEIKVSTSKQTQGNNLLAKV